MNRPVCLLRLVQCSSPIVLVLSCERLRTAPLRALSPTGLLTAIVVLRCKARSRDQRLSGGRVPGHKRRDRSLLGALAFDPRDAARENDAGDPQPPPPPASLAPPL